MLNTLNLMQPANGIGPDDRRRTGDRRHHRISGDCESLLRPRWAGHEDCLRPQGHGDTFTRLAILASPGHPVLIDKFLEAAVEVDVDAICDGTHQHYRRYHGTHRSRRGSQRRLRLCPASHPLIGSDMVAQISAATKAMAAELKVVGLMNVQYAIKDNQLYVIEVNPRASRTIPFCQQGHWRSPGQAGDPDHDGSKSLAELGLTREVIPVHLSVKEAVLPFDRFPDVDTLLGPEMKSTGEVMGIGSDFGSGLCQGAAGCRPAPAPVRNRLHQCG
jgi:carbamoyl-phosphate synthase large subunit